MRWRFVFSRRWLGYGALTMIFATVCVSLGCWQLARRAEALGEITRIENNYDRVPVPLESALPEQEQFSESQKWLPVTATGHYLVDEQLLVRNRVRGGQPGFEVLTPLVLSSGKIFIVNRGWLPTGNNQDTPETIPLPPPGQITVTARLKASEPVISNRTSLVNQVSTIELPLIEEKLKATLYTGAYGVLVAEEPATKSALISANKPERDEGPHLSYTLQWFVFAVGGWIFFGYLLRQEYRIVNANDPQEKQRSSRRALKKIQKARTDSAIEDELLDSETGAKF